MVAPLAASNDDLVSDIVSNINLAAELQTNISNDLTVLQTSTSTPTQIAKAMQDLIDAQHLSGQYQNLDCAFNTNNGKGLSAEINSKLNAATVSMPGAGAIQYNDPTIDPTTKQPVGWRPATLLDIVQNWSNTSDAQSGSKGSFKASIDVNTYMAGEMNGASIMGTTVNSGVSFPWMQNPTKDANGNATGAYTIKDANGNVINGGLVPDSSGVQQHDPACGSDYSTGNVEMQGNAQALAYCMTVNS